MKSTINTTTAVTLELNAEEAQWIHHLMQRPIEWIARIDPEGEAQSDKEMRIRFSMATDINGGK